MSLDFSRCRLPPFQHQREDVAWLIDQRYAFIASEMRTGKSKTVIDAAQFLYEMGIIDTVITAAPAPVRDVWYDPTLGELAKHLWLETPALVYEYHATVKGWKHGPEVKKPLTFWVTNFEFLRSKERIKELLAVCGPKTLLVGDESSFLKNWTSQQTKAFLQLRKKCGRCWLLNGTPVYHSPKDLFSQGNILHGSILECPYVTLFNARYAIQTPILGHGGKPLKKIVGKGKFTKEIIVQEITGWTNLDDLERRFKPHTVRRLQKDCLDLPPKLDPVTLTATLTPETWKAYRAMRDELVVWLTSGRVVMSGTAAIKALRLSQITNGFLSGAEDSGVEEPSDNLFEWDHATALALGPPGYTLDELDNGLDERDAEFGIIREVPQPSVVEIGREKLEVLLWLIGERLEADPNLHMVAWGRYRHEVLRMVAEVKRVFPQFECGTVMGQKKAERLAALALLKPETSPEGPVFVGGIEGTGSFGLDMTASHTCVTMSSGYSPGKSAQTLDRVYGPGQKHPIAYYNIIATGPKGQKTIDHDILVARMTGENIATRTASAWVTALTKE